MTNPRRALIVVDVQQEYFAGPLEIQFPPRDESLANIVGAMDAAGAHDIPVVVVQHRSPAGAPAFVEGTPGWALHPAIEERTATASKHLHKQYSSVFAGTDLVEWLRAREVDTVTIVGYMTNNCDLGTAVEAEGHGFTAEILSDATGAVHLANEAGRVSAADLHSTLMVLLQSNYAAVGTTAEWIESLRSGTPSSRSDLVTSAIAGRSAATPVTSA
ncbi:isochorismatase family protein [Nocardia speluncae]|uniref:Isochorismatase family protein n=1 Tax=Nocardia speluncae TaxID=419477 RepID=A0A846XJJ8_9NOCA|nr:isochorismatase family protein [Nocardia speluncae]NKY35459.1 isochorismatase family protein [Nocardia speluncae]